MPTTTYDSPDDAVPRHVLIELMHTLAKYAQDAEDGEGMAAWMNQITPPYTDAQADAYRSGLIDANQYIGQLIGVNVDNL